MIKEVLGALSLYLGGESPNLWRTIIISMLYLILAVVGGILFLLTVVGWHARDVEGYGHPKSDRVSLRWCALSLALVIGALSGYWLTTTPFLLVLLIAVTSYDSLFGRG